MSYYVAVGRSSTPESEREEIERGERPRHVLLQVRDALDAQWLTTRDDDPVSLRDRLMSKVFSFSPDAWALGRRLAKELTAEDVVFAPGEHIGLPLAVAMRRLGTQAPRLLFQVHNLNRPRTRTLFKTLLRLNAVPAEQLRLSFLCTSATQGKFLTDHVGVPASHVLATDDQTDLKFWTPGESELEVEQPLVVTVGAEQRDEATLWQAVAPLDAELRTTGWSADATAASVGEPSAGNSTKARRVVTGRLSWPDLRAMYRAADVVAVSVHSGDYAAGITSLMEALACGRPVVVTRTDGLQEYLSETPFLRVVEPGNVEQMREAIQSFLSNKQTKPPQPAAREMAESRFDSDRFVGQIVDLMRNPFAPPGPYLSIPFPLMDAAPDGR